MSTFILELGLLVDIEVKVFARYIWLSKKNWCPPWGRLIFYEEKSYGVYKKQDCWIERSKTWWQ